MKFKTNLNRSIIFSVCLLVLLLSLFGIIIFSTVTVMGLDVPSESWWLLIPILIIGGLLIWLLYKGKIKIITYVFSVIIITFVIMVLSNLFEGLITGDDAATRTAKRMAKEAEEQLAEEQKPVSCASKEKDQLENIDGFTMEIFAISGELNPNGILDTTKKIDKNSFNIQALKTNLGNEGLNDIVAIAKVTDNQTRDYATWMQVCNSDNKTKKRNALPIFEEGYIFSQGESQYVSIKNIETIPLSAGKHRIDGYIYVDGKWHLIARLDNIDFVDEQIQENEE